MARRLVVLFTLSLPLGTASAQSPAGDTMPAQVVQRFVDGWNTRRLDSMMVAVAPEAVFAELPSGVPFAVGRDTIRAQYEAGMAKVAPGSRVRIVQRTVDLAFVLDHEQFVNAEGGVEGRASWLYLVTGGLIRRAWELVQPGAAP